MKRVFITDHAIKQFRERFRKEAGQSTSPREIRNLIWDYIVPENENKQILNNSKMMNEIYENHGIANYTFFSKDDKVFVCVQDDYKTVTVITVLYQRYNGKTGMLRQKKRYSA